MLEFNKTNFATLEDAQSYVYEEETHKITSGKAGAWFGSQTTTYGVPEGGDPKQLLALIDEILENKLHPLYSLMKLINSTLSKNSFFGIDPSKPLGVSNRYSLNVLITAGILTQQQADQFLALSISTSKPYENKTQSDWDALDNIGVYSSQSIEWQQGQDIVVNLLEPIETGASVTTWLTNEGFAPENMGRSVYVSNALKYTIRMSDKRGSGTIEVRVNDSNAQFELEAI